MAGIFDIGGGKSAKFENQGDRIQGVVESFKVSQQNKFDSVNWKPTNDPDFWPSGDPKMQVTIAVDTLKGGAPQQDSAEDDGVRNVYATITSGEGTMFRAIQDAIKAAHGGVKADIEQGAFLDIWFSGYDPNSKNKQNPKKVYGAAYRRPAGPFAGAAEAQPQQADQGNPWNAAPAAAPVQQQFAPAPAGNFQPQGHNPAMQHGGGYVQQGAPSGPPAQQFQQPQAQQFAPAPQQFEQPQAFQQAAAAAAAAPGWAQTAPAGPGPFQQGGGIDFAAMAAQQGAGQQFGQAPGQDDPNRAAQVQQAAAHFPNAPQPEPQYAGGSMAPGQAAAPAAAVSVDMQRVQALLSAQMDDATIMQATGISPEQLNLVKNAAAVPAGMPQ